MKPQNKLQLRVFGLAQGLPKLTANQKTWALQHCLKHHAYRTKKDTSCLDCGHVWTGQTGKACSCPNCGTALTITDTRKKVTAQRAFFSIIDMRQEFQVCRFFELLTDHKGGRKANRSVIECAQIWLQENGKVVLVARNRGGMGYYTDHFNGSLEIRTTKAGWNRVWEDKYDILPDKVWPVMNTLPIYKRNGFKNNFGDLSPYQMFSTILVDGKAETLLKTRQYALLGARIGNNKHKIDRYWQSVKICIRNKYTVKDAITWLDYVTLLDYFNRDLNSHMYVCPANLKQAHNELVAKKQVIDERRRVEREQADAEAKRRKLEADALAYIKNRQAYFGLMFTDGIITIKVLESVDEFREEGKALAHCVFTNEYYTKKNSLVLSARIDGKPIETIEVIIPSMKIEQSRGVGNEATKHNQQILKLLRKNLPLIRKVYKQIHPPKKIAA